MRSTKRGIVTAFVLLSGVAVAQAPATAPPAAPAAAPAAPAAPAGQDAAASLLKVYVFPANNQTPDQQSKDSNDCYAWAKQQTGIDPTVAPQAVTADPNAGKGSAVRGAAKGAAAGAAIGAIAGDTGKGAAIGATAGGMGGVSNRRQAKGQAEQKAAQQTQQAAATQTDTFKKAYSACMEGKKYTVK
jgi:hypothetical protein